MEEDLDQQLFYWKLTALGILFFCITSIFVITLISNKRLKESKFEITVLKLKYEKEKILKGQNLIIAEIHSRKNELIGYQVSFETTHNVQLRDSINFDLTYVLRYKTDVNGEEYIDYYNEKINDIISDKLKVTSKYQLGEFTQNYSNIQEIMFDEMKKVFHYDNLGIETFWLNNGHDVEQYLASIKHSRLSNVKYANNKLNIAKKRLAEKTDIFNEMKLLITVMENDTLHMVSPYDSTNIMQRIDSLYTVLNK